MLDNEWCDVMAVNLDGFFYCMRAVILIFRKHKSGSIVNIMSYIVVCGVRGGANYVASKVALINLTKSKKGEIEWRYVRGHTGIKGNERCDEIAVLLREGKYVDLYEGPLKNYFYDISELPKNEPLPEMKPKGEKAKPYSYLSLIGNIPMRHKDWADCERRVKGQSGAKFKKAMSFDDESEILASWGIDPSLLKS
jgi:hypothetical protein